MLYGDWNTAVGAILEIQMVAPTTINPSSDSNYNSIYPRAIEYTELRIQRDLDLITTIITDNTASLSANSRLVTLPGNGAFVVVSEVTPLVNGVRQPTMTWVSREFIDSAWPADQAPSTPSIPYLVCRRDQTSVLVAPAPDASYNLEVTGTQRVVPLSASNSSNWISTFLPDLYLAASFVWFFGYQRDYGGQGQVDDAQAAMSWEKQYEALLKGSAVEEFRKKQQSQGFGNRLPSPIATPPQT